ncbi:MAG: hypothetical protein LBI15_00185 [Dysgonamonadaceae bacterium]|jgi:DNA-binding CsgD family transcriptional regulator|nr:hypothetical protein [Dysgonamonadaceae bacterium]
MPNRKNYTLLSLLIFQTCFGAMANFPADVGNAYLETFQGKSGNLGKSQIWSIASGNDNYMFFASNYGLGVFDGVRWETYTTGNSGGDIIRDLYFDQRTNTLYSGSVNQFGKWRQDRYGKFFYTPIWINQEPNTTVDFWRIDSPTSNGGGKIYAQSRQMILKYDTVSEKTDTITTTDDFVFMSIVSGDIWIQKKSRLYRIDVQNNFHEMTTVESRVMHAARRRSDSRALLFMEHTGVFVLSDDYTNMIPLNEQTNRILSEAKIFSVSETPDAKYLIGTTRGGLFLIDEQGNILKNVNESNGLPTSTVLSTGLDNRRNIWMGLEAGVSRLNIATGERYFSPTPSIGFVRSVLPFNGALYLGTNQGVFKLSSDDEISAIEGTAGSVWALYNVGEEMIYVHDLGVFRFSNNTPMQIKEGGTISLIRSLTNPSVYVSVDYYGLSLFRLVDGKLTYVSKIDNFAGTTRQMMFDRYGFLWLVMPNDGFVRLTLSDDFTSVVDIRAYDMSSGDFLLTMIDNQLVFFDGSTPFVYEHNSSEELMPEHRLAELFRLCGTNLISLNQFDNIFWFQTADNIGYIVRQGDWFEKNSGIFSHIYNKRVSPSFTQINGNNFAVGYQNGVAFTQLSNHPSERLKIRYIKGIGVGEPVFHNFGQKQFRLPNNKRILNIYPINLNADRVVEYRILERGSEWKREVVDNALTLTNLDWGVYTIQLRNANDLEATPVEFSVRIGAPWYASYPMILAYLFAIGTIIFFISLYFERKSEREKKRVEFINQVEAEKKEKTILKLEKEKLSIGIKEKDQQLAFITMNNCKRNNLMNELKQDMQNIEKFAQNKEILSAIKNVEKKIDKELANNEDWETFEKYFNVVFGGLLEQLVEKYPQLTQNDLKLMAYLKLNLNNKEIASLLNISHRSVEMAKYRLRKKLDLEAYDDFTSILNNKQLNNK